MNLGAIVAFVFFVLLSGFLVFFFVKKNSGIRAVLRAKEEAKEIYEKAMEEADKIKREASIEAKEKLINLKSDFEDQTRNQRRKLSDMERRLVQKEENLERKFKNLERRERNISNKEQRLFARERELKEQEKENQEIRNKLLHMMLSHHGSNEFGSPKAPMFPEALAVYHADEMSSKISEIVEFVKESGKTTEDDFMFHRRKGHNIYLK